MQRVIELRCPVGPRRLLAKSWVEGDGPQRAEGNLLELNCDDCKRALRKQGRQVIRVLHRYNVLGELIESVVV